MTQLGNLNLVLIFEAFPILTFTDKIQRTGYKTGPQKGQR